MQYPLRKRPYGEAEQGNLKATTEFPSFKTLVITLPQSFKENQWMEEKPQDKQTRKTRQGQSTL